LTNNDILRRIRYTYNYNDKKMVAIFALADQQISREQVCNWLKKEDDNDYVNCTDVMLATFLNGFINEKRGKRAGEQPIPEKKLNNNIILTKLKIALALKAEDLIDVLKLADLRISKPELSAFFRKSDHKHFRECKDQILRNFLQGMQEKYYVERSKKIDFSAKNEDVNAKNEAKNNAKNETSELSNKPSKSINKPIAKKTIYVNPNAKPASPKKDQTKPQRKVLKLKPEDIYKS